MRGVRALLPCFSPNFLVVGEPSQWDRITLGYKGSAGVQLTVRRPQAHSASGLETASEAAFSVWQRLQEQAAVFNLERSRQFDRLQLTLRNINSVEDENETTASLQINARLPADLAPIELLSMMQTWAGSAALKCQESQSQPFRQKRTQFWLAHSWRASVPKEVSRDLCSKLALRISTWQRQPGNVQRLLTAPGIRASIIRPMSISL